MAPMGVAISTSVCTIALLLSALANAAPAVPAVSPDASSILLSYAGGFGPISSSAPSNTAASSTRSTADPDATIPFISTDPNNPLWSESTGATVEPIRNRLGATILGPLNNALDKENSALVAPPTTDHGTILNAKWPFGLSHNRLQTGGWARQQNINEMPIATQMASVNMRLEAGAIRELHWHKTSEWAIVLKGSVQVTAVDSEGRNFISTVREGDLWFFPPGIPHSLQATADDPDGAEFILVFDSGTFSEDSTFLLTDWLAHVPAEVIAKNFQTDISAFAHVPEQELYIFPSAPPADDTADPQSLQGTVPSPFSFAFSQVKPTQLSGGTVKIVDSSTFKISTTIAAAEVTVEPGAMRELHWHPTQDEWSLFLRGHGRMTIFAAQSNARTFDYQAGDIGYVPASMGHYVENVGNTTLHFLEIFNTDKFQDISLNQWLALTPPALVKAHLNLSDDTIARLSKTKNVVVGPPHS